MQKSSDAEERRCRRRSDGADADGRGGNRTGGMPGWPTAPLIIRIARKLRICVGGVGGVLCVVCDSVTPTTWA